MRKGTSHMNNLLHEKDEPRQPLFRPGRLISMMDILGGGDCTCDHCGRWQEVRALTASDGREQLKKTGWTFKNGEDICPKCSQTRTREKPGLASASKRRKP